MKYTVKIMNYGSPAMTRPYIIEPRLNGQIMTKKVKTFRSLKTARKFVDETFVGAEVIEDIHNGKAKDAQLSAAMKWLEGLDED